MFICLGSHVWLLFAAFLILINYPSNLQGIETTDLRAGPLRSEKLSSAQDFSQPLSSISATTVITAATSATSATSAQVCN